MRGVDIASWQAGIRPGQLDADFVIVKATEGVSYVNPYWREWAEEVLASGKLLGLYHYADGGDVYAEANFFLDTVGDFTGRALLVLDWESGGNASFGMHSAWTHPWLDYVAKRTGSTPMVYASASIVGLVDTGWPLWVAQYPDYEPTGYQEHPWNEGAYSCEIRQYSSVGRVDGYSGNLDINKAYIDRATWLRWQGENAWLETAIGADSEDEDMKPTIIGLDGNPTLYALDGGRVMRFDDEQQLDTYKAFYAQRYGYEVPVFYWDDAERFEAFVRLHRAND